MTLKSWGSLMIRGNSIALLLHQSIQGKSSRSQRSLTRTLGNLEIKFPENRDKPIRSYWDFLKKWYLQWFPSELFAHPTEALKGSDAVPGGEPLPSTPGDLEKVVAQALYEARQNPKSNEMLRPAVIGTEPFDQWSEEQTEQWDGTEQVVEVPSDIPWPGTVLNIRVDLSYPQDVIEAEINRQVRKAKDRRQELEDQGLLPGRPERLRLDKINFQLKVYDLAKAGKTFREIHDETNRPVSSVKSALLAVSSKIASLVIPAILPPRVSKESLPLLGFDSNAHISHCPQCRSANMLEEMCDLAKRYVEQDHVSQRELPGVDTVQDVKDSDTTDWIPSSPVVAPFIQPSLEIPSSVIAKIGLPLFRPFQWVESVIGAEKNGRPTHIAKGGEKE
jgi:hypothetical protein